MKLTEKEWPIWYVHDQGGEIRITYSEKEAEEVLSLALEKIKSVKGKYKSLNPKFDIDMYSHRMNIQWTRDNSPEEKDLFKKQKKEENIEDKKRQIREVKRMAKKLKLL
jgi:hypothetical protein